MYILKLTFENENEYGIILQLEYSQYISKSVAVYYS